MQDTKSNKLSSDRLAMRISLIRNEDNHFSLDDMDSIFNNHRPNIEAVIASKLDPNGKGYADYEDLLQIIESNIADGQTAQQLASFVKQSLEFKNVDKVYYSPLFGLPPPFFRYGKKFD